jgi:transcriptional antiterminator RfaH
MVHDRKDNRMPLLRKEPEIFPDDLFDAREPWRVAHVRSRQEKVLARHLLRHGVPFYAPQMERTVVRGGRRLTSHLPLFAGYVFFRGDAAARQTALRSNVVARLIEVEDQGLLEAELHQIRQLQLAGASLIPVEEFAAGDAVRIGEGAFAGYQGTVVRGGRGDRLVVSVSLLRKSVAVEFPKEALKRRRTG